MIAIVFLVSALLCGVLGAPTEERIQGGTVAKSGEFPYIVSLRFFGGHGCGGSILDKRHVMTASHCVNGQKAEDLSIQYGVIDIWSVENVVQVAAIKMHENYFHGGNYPNDIAILTLAADIKIDNKNVQAVRLPDRYPAINNQIDAVLAGWGYASSAEPEVQRYLLRTNLAMFHHDLCQSYLPTYDPELHVCAGELDGSHKQCSGDSGGPLNANGLQYGIVSWSYKPCNIKGRPGLFANVANYRAWIKTNSGV